MAATDLLESIRASYALSYPDDLKKKRDSVIPFFKSIGLDLTSLEEINTDLDNDQYSEYLKIANNISDAKSKSFALDLLSFNNVKWKLSQPNPDHFEVFQGLSNEKDQKFVNSFISSFGVSYAQEVLDIEKPSEQNLQETEKNIKIFEQFSKCADLMEEPQRANLMTIVYNSSSDLLDFMNTDSKIIGNRLKELHTTAKLKYSIVEDLADRYFDLLEFNTELNILPPGSSDFYVRNTNEEIAKTLLELENFPFRDDHLELFKKYSDLYRETIENLRQEMIKAQEAAKEQQSEKNPVKLSTYYQTIEIPDIRALETEDLQKYLPIKDKNSINFNECEKIYFSKRSRIYVVKALYEGEPVAVKFFIEDHKANTAKSLYNQAKYMIAMGKDPNFIQVYGALMMEIPRELSDRFMYDSRDEHGCLVMEYCFNSLADYIKSDELLNKIPSIIQQETYDFSKLLIDAMKRLNSKGIKHKDIKPANILLTRDRQTRELIVKIADFDVSSSVKEMKENTTKVMETNVVGTLDYSAPELRSLLTYNQVKSSTSAASEGPKAKSKRLFNPNRADVFSLGLSMLEMACKSLVPPKSCEGLNDLKTVDGSKEILQNKIYSIIDMLGNGYLKELLKEMLVVDPTLRKPFREISALYSEQKDIATYKISEAGSDEEYSDEN